MIFRFLILIGTAIGVLRDYFFVSDASVLLQVVFSLFIAEMIVDVILRFIFLRVFNQPFDRNPAFTAWVVRIVCLAGFFCGLGLAFTAGFYQEILWWAGIYVFVLSVFKYFFTALVVSERQVIAQTLELARVLGVSLLFFFSAFSFIPLFVGVVALLAAGYVHRSGWLPAGSAEGGLRFLNSRKPELLFQLQAIIFIAICILEKSFIISSDGELLLLTLAIKISIVSVGLLNRLLIQPRQIAFAKMESAVNIDRAILKDSVLFGALSGSGFLIAFLMLGPYFAFDVSFASVTDLFFTSTLVALFSIREGAVRVLLRRDQPFPVGLSGVMGFSFLLAYLVVAEPNFVQYVGIYICIIIVQISFNFLVTYFYRDTQ